MNELLPAPIRPARRLRRIALAASAAALGAGLLLAPSGTASAADNFGPGYPIPASSGIGISHIGGYTHLTGINGTAYCGDPDLSGPDTAGGYGPPTTVTSWTSNVTGKPVSATDLHRAAYVLSRYGQTTDDAQAAGVDAVVNTDLNPGSTDALPNGARAVERLSYPDVSPTAKTNAANYMAAADEFAGPYTVHIVPRGTLHNGKATPFDTYVTSATDHELPQIPLTVHLASGKDTQTLKYTTDANGDYLLKLTPYPNAGVTMTIDATLPGTSVNAVSPQNPKAQRMVLSGLTSTAETKLTVPNGTGGTIKITKTAADTGKAMAGVEFAVKDASGKTDSTGKTNASGIWQTGQLPPGRYTVHEVKAALGYQLAADKTVTVTADQTTALTVKDVRIPTSTPPKPRPVTIPQLPQTGA